jgi:hypothetical protein
MITALSAAKAYGSAQSLTKIGGDLPGRAAPPSSRWAAPPSQTWSRA